MSFPVYGPDGKLDEIFHVPDDPLVVMPDGRPISAWRFQMEHSDRTSHQLEEREQLLRNREAACYIAEWAMEQAPNGVETIVSVRIDKTTMREHNTTQGILDAALKTAEVKVKNGR